MNDPITTAYIASLPEVETSRLPNETMFLANGRIYEVVETSAGGFHKAREWRKTEKTDVALIPNSFPSRYLPLVTRGKLLPVYRSRQELAQNAQTICYVFPTESLALDAATLDVDLVQGGGAYVREHGEEPAFAATDGVHNFRLYYYRFSAAGRRTNLSRLEVRPAPFTIKSHLDGMGYWRLLPTWTEGLPNHDVTRPMQRISPEELGLDDTHPHLPRLTRDDLAE